MEKLEQVVKDVTDRQRQKLGELLRSFDGILAKSVDSLRKQKGFTPEARGELDAEMSASLTALSALLTSLEDIFSTAFLEMHEEMGRAIDGMIQREDKVQGGGKMNSGGKV